MDEKKYIALTFDDGPTDTTPYILDILERLGVPGSFFLIGNNITDETLPLIHREMDMGCDICNHSLTHQDMTTLSSDTIKNEIEETSSRIEKITGRAPVFFRPPYIAVNDDMHDVIDLTFICGIDSMDWDAATSVQERMDNVLNSVSDGSIILMHDFEGNEKTVLALPILIEELRKRGFTFVTLTDLFRVKGIDPTVPSRGKIWTLVE